MGNAPTKEGKGGRFKFWKKRSSSPPPGERILENFYFKEDVLGEGSFGVVYKGKKRDTGEEVAIKLIRRDRVNPKESVNFENEAKLMKSLEHPNIVKFYDFFKTPDQLALVMEYIPGGGIFDLLAKKETFCEAEVVTILRQVLSALEYMHSKGVAHRDIKPENLLWSGSEDAPTVKIADFGLSKNISYGDQLQTLVGTPDYVAPEIINEENETYTMAVDMWSIGVVTYVLLTGFSPFSRADDGDDITPMFKRICTADYFFPEEVFKDISEDAVDFIKKCLELDPAARMTAEQALHHQWIAEKACQKSLPKASMDNLSIYMTKRKANNKQKK